MCSGISWPLSLSGAFAVSGKMAKWDSKDLDIRSKSVEETLVPLVTQVRRNVARTTEYSFLFRIAPHNGLNLVLASRITPSD